MKFIETILKNSPVYLPRKVAKLLSNEARFIRLVTYLDEFGHYVGTTEEPIEGEVGVWNGARIVVIESQNQTKR